MSAPVLDLLNFALQSGPGEEFAADIAEPRGGCRCPAGRHGVLDEGPLGRLGATERLEGYATAVLSSVRGERQLGDIEDELFRFMRIVEGNDELRVALTTAELPAPAAPGRRPDLLARRASQESARMATLCRRVGRPRDYPAPARRPCHAWPKRPTGGWPMSARQWNMTAPQRARLAAALTNFTGYPVDVRVTPEPAASRRFCGHIGDMVIDASLRHRLELAREALLVAPAARPASPTSAAGKPAEH